MISLLFILLSFSYSQSSDFSEEVIMKEFTPSGSIESLIDDYNGTYYLVQLDLKNDSLYNIANNILPHAELFNGPASYHRIMTLEHLSAILEEISSNYIIVLKASNGQLKAWK